MPHIFNAEQIDKPINGNDIFEKSQKYFYIFIFTLSEDIKKSTEK